MLPAYVLSLVFENNLFAKYHKFQSNAREKVHMAISMHIPIIIVIVAPLNVFCIDVLLSFNIVYTLPHIEAVVNTLFCVFSLIFLMFYVFLHN